MAKKLPFFLIIFSAVVMSFFLKSSNVDEPDFSMPKNVITHAEKLLIDSQKLPEIEGSSQRLYALGLLVEAKTKINPDERFKLPALIHDYIVKEKYSPAKAIMLLYEADVLLDIYREDSWTYDRVEIPLEPRAVDISEWSGAQFKDEITRLVEEAVNESLILPDASVKPFLTSLIGNEFSEKITPTVTLFVLNRGAKILSRIYEKDKEVELLTKGLEYCSIPSEAYFCFQCELITHDADDGVVFWGGKLDTTVTQKLQDLYSQYSSDESARYVLEILAKRWTRPAFDCDAPEKKQFLDNVELINESLRLFPKWYNNASLENCKAKLTEPTIKIKANNLSYPGKEIKLDILQSFTTTAEILVYKSDSVLGFLSNKYPVYKTIRLTPCGFDLNVDTVVNFLANSPGYYYFLPKVEKDLYERGTFVEVHVTHLMPIGVGNVENPYCLVVNSESGIPEKDVQIIQTGSELGRTDEKGITRIANYNNDYRKRAITIRQGKFSDVYDNLNFNVFNFKSLSKDKLGAKIFTSRPLYKLGQEVEWTAIVTEAKKGTVSLSTTRTSSNRRVEMVVKNSNWQTIFSDTLTTDDFGRIGGSFNLPSEGLTGTFVIQLHDLAENEFISYASFEVSDFKLPEYYVEIIDIRKNSPKDGDITVCGQARTYTGMPVNGAQVEVRFLSSIPWWLRFYENDSFICKEDATTDGDGKFEVVLKKKDYEDFSALAIKAEVIVTNMAGESVFASKTFTVGKPYYLQVTTSPENTNVDCSKAFSFKVSAMSIDNPGGKRDLQFNWSLVKNGKEDTSILSGIGETDKEISLKVSEFEAGNYKIIVSPIDTIFAEKNESQKMTFYNSRKGLIPEGKPIFVPETKVQVENNGNGEILVGVAENNTWIYILTSSGDKCDLKSLCLTKGFHKIAVSSSDNPNIVSKVELLSIRDCEVYEFTVDLVLPPKPKTILKIESMRDKTSPNAEEKWTLKFETSDGKPLDGYAVSTMYSKALLALIPSNWPGVFSKDKFHSSMYLYYSSKRNISCESILKPIRRKRETSAMPYIFKFQPYDDLKMREGINDLNYAGSMKLMSRATSMSFEEESVETGSMDDSAISEESNDLTENVNELREVDVLQAFWMPTLRTSEDGAIEISFKAPNALGAWMFEAFAWDKDLNSAVTSQELVTAKPLMVQTAVPRFVRAGDSVVLKATVYNNSDFGSTVKVKFDITDENSVKIGSKTVILDSIEPGHSAIVELPLDIPTDIASLKYTIKAISENFSDGETGVIPVLESQSVVIESECFYLNPGEKEPYEFSVKNLQDFTYTFQYCQNPIWNVVKALRGNSVSEVTSPEIASKLFSNLAIVKILKDNPEIETIIKKWKENPSEGALTSLLENNDLKNVLLSETPWELYAESQTQRMQALAEYLDSDVAEKNIEKLLKKLSTLQTSNGGFKWMSESREASAWATENVLISLGIALSMDMGLSHEDEILNISKLALNFIDNSLREINIKDDSFDIMFAYCHCLYAKKFKPSTKLAEKLVNNTLKQVVKRRADLSIIEKGYATIILNSYGKKKDSSEMVNSIKQFAVETPRKGVTLPSVNDIRGYATLIQALDLIGVDRQFIDGLRQWVILQTQTKDDLGAYNPDYVIAAIMATGSVWTNIPVVNSVKINNENLEITTQESGSGYFSQQLPKLNSKKIEVSVMPNGVTPSYGSLTWIGKKPMAEIKPKNGDGISIQKRLLVNRGGEWEDADLKDIRIGELVRVDLVVKVDEYMEYIVITDDRPTGFEPKQQISEYVFGSSLYYYREMRDSQTRLFISWLPKGTHHLSYEGTFSIEGHLSSGIALIQSQYAPEKTAHSGGSYIRTSSSKQ